MFLKGIAMELASKGIRCNVIAPGPVWTPLVVSSFPSEMVPPPSTPSSLELSMNRPVLRNAEIGVLILHAKRGVTTVPGRSRLVRGNKTETAVLCCRHHNLVRAGAWRSP